MKTITEEQYKRLLDLECEKAKYGWHDLRKDQNDLPDGECIDSIIFVWKGESREIWYDSGWFLNHPIYGKSFHTKNAVPFEASDVIAWKYIDPFE